MGLPAPSDPLCGRETCPSRAGTTSPSVPGSVVASVCRPHQLQATMQRAVSMVAHLGLRLQALPSALGRPFSCAQVGSRVPGEGASFGGGGGKRVEVGTLVALNPATRRTYSAGHHSMTFTWLMAGRWWRLQAGVCLCNTGTATLTHTCTHAGTARSLTCPTCCR